VFLPVRVDQAGKSEQTVYSSEATPDGVKRITRVVAPAPDAWTCNQEDGATLNNGCRRLELVYATDTTATGTTAGTWGDYKDRLVAVKFRAYDPASNAVTVDEVARYAYDTDGRLRASWDPRISPALKTTYDYDAARSSA
jgi:hypothetical protein